MLLIESTSNPSPTAVLTTSSRNSVNQHTLNYPTSLSFSNKSTIELDAQLRHRVEVAKQKLQATDQPWLLRVTFYLRVLCTVIQKSSVQGDQLEQNNSPQISYSQLMQSLFAYHPEWWQQCTVTKAGKLVSENLTIQALLSPLHSIL